MWAQVAGQRIGYVRASTLDQDEKRPARPTAQLPSQPLDGPKTWYAEAPSENSRHNLCMRPPCNSLARFGYTPT